jgi:predicted alpha/beta superfamily hydrolase
MNALLLLSLLLACRPGDTDEPEDDTAPPGETGDSDTSDDTGETGDTGDTDDPVTGDCVDDEQSVRALIATANPTSAQVDAVLAGVAAGCGWPIEAGNGAMLFACNCGNGDWSVAGDFDDWQGQAMTRNGALHWAEIEVPSPTDAGYKLTDGVHWEADPYARRYLYDSFGELSLVRAQQAHLERWPGFEAQGLRSRTVRVWVPTAGQFDRVLFAHDGQNLFDPDAIWGGWRMQEALPDGILVVANDNTADRMEEYTHVQDHIHGAWYGGEGDTYATFVHEQLRPWAEQTYGAATMHGLLGSSLGGLISLHIALRYPGEYRFAASMSGTLGWGSIGATNETMIERYAAAGHGSTAIYLDSGGSGTCYDSDGDGIQDDDPSAGDNYCETNQMAATLAELGYQYEQDLWHWWEPGAEHNEVAWAERVALPLTVFASLD